MCDLESIIEDYGYIKNFSCLNQHLPVKFVLNTQKNKVAPDVVKHTVYLNLSVYSLFSELTHSKDHLI